MPRPVVPFDTLVQRGAPDDCWPWRGSRRPNGYGRYFVGGTAVSAHRYAYRLAYGGIAPNKVVMHSCDNKPCCNPAHLSQGTQADNSADRDRKGRGGRSPGERNGMAKLTADQVTEIRRRYAEGGSHARGKHGSVTYTSLAAEYDVLPHAIGKVVRGERW